MPSRNHHTESFEILNSPLGAPLSERIAVGKPLSCTPVWFLFLCCDYRCFNLWWQLVAYLRGLRLRSLSPSNPHCSYLSTILYPVFLEIPNSLHWEDMSSPSLWRMTKRILSSKTEHSFHGIHSRLSLESAKVYTLCPERSVTHLSGPDKKKKIGTTGFEPATYCSQSSRFITNCKLTTFDER
jgi:hypothetical protein